MNIAIVGSGNVGRALGNGWQKAGHSVTFAARDPMGAKAAELKRDGFAVAPQGDAGKAEAIVLAVPWTGIEATVRALGDLAGTATSGYRQARICPPSPITIHEVEFFLEYPR